MKRQSVQRRWIVIGDDGRPITPYMNDAEWRAYSGHHSVKWKWAATVALIVAGIALSMLVAKV